ncbi:MAG: hypothetical protein Pg6C_00450 [Treponemataceae bacterium]|nr:MAG: hypothetical protein Pg6C_00450 [Treponemataceae bacterium]
MRYWTFKHQLGTNKTENECKPFIEKAIKLNSALMQSNMDFKTNGPSLLIENLSKTI